MRKDNMQHNKWPKCCTTSGALKTKAEEAMKNKCMFFEKVKEEFGFFKFLVLFVLF